MQDRKSIDNGWLDLALALNQRLTITKVESRAKLVEASAAKVGCKLATLRRQLVAADYVAKRIGAERLGADEVQGSVAAIENLRRLEQIAPSRAAAIRRDVLRGRLTHRAVMAEVRAATRPAKQRPLSDLVCTVIGLCEAEGLDVQAIIERGSSDMSPLGEIFDVDAEVKTAKGVQGIFVSPGISVEGRSVGAFGVQMFKVLASLIAYKQVILGCSREEGEELADILYRAKKEVRARVKVVAIASEAED